MTTERVPGASPGETTGADLDDLFDAWLTEPELPDLPAAS